MILVRVVSRCKYKYIVCICKQLFVIKCLNILKHVYMEENQRFRNVITSLKENKRVRNQQDFVERIGSDKTTISQIVNNKIMIPNNLFAKIKEAFPEVSIEWIKSGDGELFNSPVVQTNQNGDNIHGQSVTVNKSETEKLLEALDKCHELLKKKDEQIDKLLNMLNK